MMKVRIGLQFITKIRLHSSLPYIPNISTPALSNTSSHTLNKQREKLRGGADRRGAAGGEGGGMM